MMASLSEVQSTWGVHLFWCLCWKNMSLEEGIYTCLGNCHPFTWILPHLLHYWFIDTLYLLFQGIGAASCWNLAGDRLNFLWGVILDSQLVISNFLDSCDHLPSSFHLIRSQNRYSLPDWAILISFPEAVFYISLIDTLRPPSFIIQHF